MLSRDSIVRIICNDKSLRDFRIALYTMKAASSCVTIANTCDDSRLRKRRTKINEATKEDVNIISGMQETKKTSMPIQWT